MTYHRPGTLEQALQICARPKVKVLAGGTDVYPAQTGRDLMAETLDLTAIAALSGITKTEQGWRIGATTRWSEVAQADLPQGFDTLKQAAIEVGSVQIQNAGTVAGNLCNASPAADGVPPLLVLEAEVELASQTTTRRLPLATFLTGVRRTALGQGEIVTALHIPDAACTGQSAFVKLGARKYMVISVAMVAVRLELAGNKISNAAIAVGACSPVAQRLRGLEAALKGHSINSPEAWQDAMQTDIAAHLSPIDDIRADAAYRTHVVARLLNQAIAQAGAA
jgi:CO/xanthine dehydrogenase FAD-binding subunit